MENKKKEFIEKALHVYMKYGIKSVTMDEMARQLGVSKKTVYQYVSDKNELVEECIKCSNNVEIELVKKIIKENDNAIDEVLAISQLVGENLNKIHPSIFFDLAKYHPNSLKLIDCYKDDFVGGCVEDNLRKGIQQGFYRENLNIEIIKKLYLKMMDYMLAVDVFEDSKISRSKVYEEVFRYHIRGIASEKGIEYLYKKLNNI